MVNMLRFKQPDGLEHYFRYGAEIAPMLQQAGATLRYVGSSSLYVIGDGPRPWWDIVIVEIPTPEAFLIMVTSEEYRVAHVHRAAALDGAELIAMSPFWCTECSIDNDMPDADGNGPHSVGSWMHLEYAGSNQ